MSNNKPIEIRDGRVKALIWTNTRNDGAKFRSVTFVRSYKDADDKWQETTESFGGTDILKLQNLATLAYRKILELNQEDAKNKEAA